MSEPTSNYSMFDLILRVAKAAGIAYYGSDGQKKASIPVNEHDVERCKDVVTDAIKMFIADAPVNGWRWMRRIAAITFATVETTGECDSVGSSTTLVDSDLENTYDTDDEIVGYYVYDLTQEIYGICTGYVASTSTITCSAGWLDYNDNASSLTPADEDDYSITNLKTVEGDKARYFLPEDFQGNVIGKITYAKDSNRGHIIDWAGEGEIRMRREVNVTISHPNRAAVRPYGSRRWELIVNPSPTAADTVIFPYELGFDKLRFESGTATNGAATAVSDSGLANLYPDDFFDNWIATIFSGTGQGATAVVTSYVGADGEFFVTDWLYSDGTAAATNPASGSAYYVEPVNNKHPAGMQFDEAILSACLAKAEMEFEDMNMGYMNKYLQKDLPAAHAIDIRSSPKKLGRMLSGSAIRRNWRVWEDVTNWSYNPTTGLWDISRDV